MDMSKYLALFIEESREHLGAFARLIVDLEGSADSATILDDIFRHVHSVKGMAASMEFTPIATLSHYCEDVVHGFRASRAGIPAEVVDLLLQVADALTDQVESVAAEAEVASFDGLVARLRAFTSGDTGVDSAAEALAEPGASEADSLELPSLSAAVGGAETGDGANADKLGDDGGSPLEVVVELDPECSSPSIRAFLVYKKAGDLGDVLDAVPSNDDVRGGSFQGKTLRLRLSGVSMESLQEALSRVPDVISVRPASDHDSKPSTVQPEAESVPAGPPAPAGTSEKSAVASGPPPPETRATKREPDKGTATIRVRTDILDGLLDTVGELFISRERLRVLLGDHDSPEVRAALDGLETRIRDIHSQVLAVRMTPLRTLTERYPRLVRDLARSLSKQVEFHVEGQDIELDRAILEALDTPFVHTLRNAVDHGLEDPNERLTSGKPGQARVSLSATRDRDRVLVAIEDDGRGLDPEKLRATAVARGLLSEAQAATLTTRECFFLICAPGFSTKGAVTDVSGRGVGMDVVRSKIEALNGSLEIESTRGQGTRFTFALPLTLAIINVLLIRSGGRIFAVPVTKVVAVREIGKDAVEDSTGGRFLSFRHALAPVVSLSGLLGLVSRGPAEQVVVIEDGRDLQALAVEAIVGYHDVVVKPLGEPLDRLDIFSGATILGDGEPILILDLLKALRGRSSG